MSEGNQHHYLSVSSYGEQLSQSQEQECSGLSQALVEEGKIKYIGLSEVGADDLRKAHKVHPITAVQLEWSLWTRDAEVGHAAFNVSWWHAHATPLSRLKSSCSPAQALDWNV